MGWDGGWVDAANPSRQRQTRAFSGGCVGFKVCVGGVQLHERCIVVFQCSPL